MKTCNKCFIAKPLSEFGVNRTTKDELQRCCSVCDRALQRSCRARRPRDVKYLAARKKKMYGVYGMSGDDYDAMFDYQHGVCAICYLPETTKSTTKLEGLLKPLAVDHNGETGQVRGLLCSHCNRGIGCLKHDVTFLANAIAYLDFYNEVAKETQ